MSNCAFWTRRPRCPSPRPRWNWMSGERRVGSAYQKPPVSNRVEATGPLLEQEVLQPGPDRCGAAWRSCRRCASPVHSRSRRGRGGPEGSSRRPAGRARRDADRSSGGLPARCRRACSSRGEPIAPDDTSTSRSARTRSGRPLALGDLDADRPSLLDDDAQHLRAGPDREVRPVADRLEIGQGGRASAARRARSPGSGRCRPGSLR